jgi:hypothetical protein
MNRRDFLAALLAPVVARVLPKPKPVIFLQPGDTVTVEGVSVPLRIVRSYMHDGDHFISRLDVLYGFASVPEVILSA